MRQLTVKELLELEEEAYKHVILNFPCEICGKEWTLLGIGGFIDNTNNTTIVGECCVTEKGGD